MVPAINGYFRTQPVTGQQRYATEIANRLPDLLDRVVEYRPPSPAAGNRYLEWVDLQFGLPLRARNRVLISLTSRAPVAVKRGIVTIHDLFPLTNPEWFAKDYVAVHRALLRHHLKHAAGLVVVSEPVRREVLARVRSSMPVIVAPSAAAPSLDTAVGDRHGMSAIADHGEPFCGFFLTVGSLEPRKNLATLLRAYALLDAELRAAYPLMVVGATAKVFQKDREVARWAAPGVRFLGRVLDHDLGWLYRHATTFVSVSLAEGFGVPVVESAACGRCALVLSDIPVYRWICDGGPAAFVDPRSPADIAQALRRSVNMQSDKSGLRHIAVKFSWDASAQAVADLAGSQL